MPLNSVNTNVGAMVALQNLNSTNRELDITQGRINTGLKIASAKDNGAIYAIAQGQKATSNALNAVMDSLNRGKSVVDVAMAGGETIADLLNQMKSKALAAQEAGLDTTSRTALNEEFKSLRDQIAKTVTNATFNGANMIQATGQSVFALGNADGSSRITVGAISLALGGGATGVTVTATTSFSTATQAAAARALVDASITNVSAALAKLGTGSKALDTHLNFISKLQDTVDAGIGNLIDADLAKESARLQALQTKQQLGIQALSIANSASSSILGLFR